MQADRSAQKDALIRAVFNAFEASVPALLSGPSGSGKSHMLRALSVELAARQVPHLFVNGRHRDAAASLESAPTDTVFLVDDYDHAPYEVLKAASQHALVGGKAVGTAAETLPGSDYHANIERLYVELPEASEVFSQARKIHIPLHTADEIARFVHASSTAPIDAATLATIQQLAWGRPGWARTLLQMHESGSLAHAPNAHITHVNVEHLQLAPLADAARVAAESLSPEDIAAALTLAEIGPRGQGGISVIIGSAATTRLTDAGYLMLYPDSPELYGVPELYAAAIHQLADPATLETTRRAVADHLLRQELFGIPLPEAEAVFCARVLSQQHAEQPSALHGNPEHAQFVQRVINDLVTFGEGTQARDMLLNLGQNGPGLTAIERARLSTVLRDAHTGLQAILTACPARGNVDLPPIDSETRLATMLMQGGLAAEVGIPFHSPEILPGDTVWEGARLVTLRWNDTEPLGADIGPLMKIAQTHPIAEVALIAEVLLSLEASSFGLQYRAFVGSPVKQRISQLAVQGPEILRNTAEGTAVALSLTTFFTAPPEGHDGPQQDMIAHLPAPSRHRIWSTHLQATRTAIVCNDSERASIEWSKFTSTVPRFLPLRLRDLIHKISFVPRQQPSGSEVTSHAKYLYDYFHNRLDDNIAAGLGNPYREYAAYSGGHVTAGELSEIPEFFPIHQHLQALREQNPAALTRAGEELERQGLWVPALNAYQEARRIYLRRRATGSVTTIDERIQELETAVLKTVPWFAPHPLPLAQRERLTPREMTAAQLATNGLSNREIAERMQCSTRTVESHIAQARAKLGLASRDELKKHFAPTEQPV